jgi:RNA polymerase-associated protein
VLFEKGMDFEIRDVDLYNKPEDISVMNPYGQVPILVERDLILYESNIINEYIDERFPHPQLMPGDPVDRARVRLFLLNFEKELFVHVSALENRATKGTDKALEKARAHIRDRLTQLAPVFLKNKYMLGDGFSMLDVAIAPLLWRLDYYGIDLSKNAAPLLKYAETDFFATGLYRGADALGKGDAQVHRLRRPRMSRLPQRLSPASRTRPRLRNVRWGCTLHVPRSLPRKRTVLKSVESESRPASAGGSSDDSPEPPPSGGGRPTLRRIK